MPRGAHPVWFRTPTPPHPAGFVTRPARSRVVRALGFVPPARRIFNGPRPVPREPETFL